MSRQRPINVYACGSCGNELVTKDVDEGVTPMMVACPKCDKMMFSAFYRVDQTLKPDREWYRPSTEELEKLTFPTREHVAKGGLIMRDATESTRGA